MVAGLTLDICFTHTVTRLLVTEVGAVERTNAVTSAGCKKNAICLTPNSRFIFSPWCGVKRIIQSKQEKCKVVVSP